MYLVYVTRNTNTVTLLKLNVGFRLSGSFIYTKWTPYQHRYGVSNINWSKPLFSKTKCISFLLYARFLAYILMITYFVNLSIKKTTKKLLIYLSYLVISSTISLIFTLLSFKLNLG